MPYGKGQPKEETVIAYGTGNHILVRWGNLHFSFLPEGDLCISSGDTDKLLFVGDDMDLIEKLAKQKEAL